MYQQTPFAPTTQGLKTQVISSWISVFLLFLSPIGVKATKFSLPQANTMVLLWQQRPKHFCVCMCVFEQTVCASVFVRRAVRSRGSANHSPHSNKTLVVPERFAPFFEHRSISTNSTGAVKTHLTDADASLDQKQPFYTAASFVLIHVSLLRDWLLFYLPNIQAFTLLKLTES